MSFFTRILGIPDLYADDEDFDKNIYSVAASLGLISNSKNIDLTATGKDLGTNGSAEKRADWWTISKENWYKAMPYSFVVIDKGQSQSFSLGPVSIELTDDEYFYTLPIPPQALSIKMVPASQVTPTIGGVVEETSANTFWIINMQGTMGNGIGRGGDDLKDLQEMATIFRRKIGTTGEMAAVFAGLNRAAAKIGSLGSVFKSGTYDSIGGALSAATAGIQQMLLPTSPFATSAVRKKFNGFGEIQELHRWLLVYSKMKGAYPSRFFLKFRMYKTNQEWSCSLQDFSIQQNAQNPNLYRYSMQLKCWGVCNIQTGADINTPSASDRFGYGGDLAPVNILSVKEMSQGFKQIGKDISRSQGK